MKFSDFENVEQVIAKYPLELRQERFLPDEVSSELPEWFKSKRKCFRKTSAALFDQ